MNKNLLSIEHDDDNENYEAFNDFLINHTERNKKTASNEIEMFGDVYLKEIEWKKKKQNEKKNKLIPYIVKHSDGRYEFNVLMEYSYEDVLNIYNQYRKKNSTLLTKIFHFIFNLS